MPDDEDQKSVFLSYAHADRVRADKIARLLEADGFTVWWDALIEGGAQFSHKIGEALDRADAVVVLWSAQSINSDWVRDEAAQGRDRSRLVPVTLDGAQPPLGFRQYQTIDLRKWNGRSRSAPAAKLLDAVRLAVGAPVAPNGAGASSPRGISRRATLALGAGAVAAAGIGYVGWNGLPGRSADDSIAVLPFKNLSGDPEQDYFAEGLTEEIRSALARVPSLKVLASTSSSKASEDDDDGKSIARKLGVTYLLEGSARQANDRLRIAVDLIDGKTGFSRWRQDVERKAADVFAVQTEIAHLVANALSLRIATDDPIVGGTRNVAAYQAYLKGKSLFNAANGEDSDRAARAQFENAISLDANFALAHAALSRVMSALGSQYSKPGEIKATFAAAVTEAQRAISLAPTLADAQLALGYARFAGQLDAKGAAEAYRKARDYGGQNADILLLYALYVVRTRKFAEARSAIERSLALDPINARTWRAAASIALASRRYADVVPLASKAIALNPEITNAHALRGQAMLLLGKIAEARRDFEAEPAPMNALPGLAIVEHRAGNMAAAQQAFDTLVRTKGDAVLYQQAQALAQFGRLDDAMGRLEKAYAVGDSGLTYLVTDPLLDPLAKQPRLTALAARMGLV